MTPRNHKAKPLILGSASPRRRALLRQAGIPFRAVQSQILEARERGESPKGHVLRLAEAKARNLEELWPEHWIIGADTVVVSGETILGKPATVQEASRMLEALQGKAHEVLTGLCVVRQCDGSFARNVVRTIVHMRSMTRAEILWYISTGEPLDKAGAYAIQGLGSIFVTRIEGSYTNVVGLPLPELALMLRELGAWDFLADP